MVRIAKIFGVLAVSIFISETTHAAALTDAKQSCDWSGTYIGAFVAHSWFDLKYYEPDWPGFERNPNINGFTGGVYLGHNFRIDNIILGVEADAGFGNLSKGADKHALNNYSAFDIDWNAHFRTRVGYAFDTTLFYVAGGLSFAKVTVDDTDPAWGKDDNVHVGWTVGAGIEHSMIKNLRLRIEYLYDDYGSKDYAINGIFPYRANVNLTAHLIRVGLSYSF